MQSHIRELLILSRIPGVGSNRLRALVSHFGDPGAVSAATPRQLTAIDGIEQKTALAITGFFRSAASADAGRYADEQLARIQRMGAGIMTYWDDAYPSSLKRIYDPPPYLFVRGALLEADAGSIAIVGTRIPTPHGAIIAERFAADLAKLGLTVVSGLARGIDTAAHAAALRVGGRTVAVIGSGLDVIYPGENKLLAARIAEHGALLSEYAMGAKPDAVNFPRRNRIISGLSLGTLVVETGIEGGAMITAATALDQNREVFAIPSGLSSRKPSGTNRLIKEGKALLTETVDDILAELGPRAEPFLRDHPMVPHQPQCLSLFEQRIYEVVEETPVHIDHLAERSGLSTADALVNLLSLEFKGLIRQMAGKMFVRT